MYARCMLLSFILSTRRGILSPFLLAQTNLLLQASTLDFIWFLWTQIMMSAGCWNRWGGWCNNFRMDGLHASLWGDYRIVHAGLFFFFWDPESNHVIIEWQFSYFYYYEELAYYCRVCWEVWSLQEIDG